MIRFTLPFRDMVLALYIILLVMNVGSIGNITIWIEFYKLKTIDRMACPLFHNVEHELTDNKTHAKSDRLQVPLLINIDI